jgi:branched-chain amino acid aminotransferase
VIPLPEQWIYLDGEFVPPEKAVISVFDHGLLYGDGVFEGIRAYNGRVFRLDQHLDRLYCSARAINLTIPMSKEQMRDRVVETIRRNGLQDAYVRLVVTRGKGDLGLDPVKCPVPTVFIIAGGIQIYPPELYEKGLRVVTLATRRNIVDALSPRIKSLNYLNNILGKLEANQANVEEGLMLTREGYVAEGTSDNVFIVGDGVVATPDLHLGVLAGITRGAVLEIAAAQSIPTEETTLTLFDVYNADECFLTGTAAELVPVVEVDGRRIGEGRPGPITKRLLHAFRELTRSEGVPI